MPHIVDIIAYSFALGVFATAFMDLCAMAQKRLLGIPSLDYALLGRWVLYLPSGRFMHTPITATNPVRGEALLGWAMHYAIGVVFAVVFIIFMTETWLSGPTLWPALLFGAATVAFPYFILQPCMGAGLAARKTPRPNVARVRSVVAHLSFGMGLYIAGNLLQAWR